jgi:hypothetical protein
MFKAVFIFYHKRLSSIVQMVLKESNLWKFATTISQLDRENISIKSPQFSTFEC